MSISGAQRLAVGTTPGTAAGGTIYVWADTSDKHIKITDDAGLETDLVSINVSNGAGAPSSTPGTLGDVYIDTTGDIVWVATGTASSADWKQATGAGGGDLLAANNLSDVANAGTSRTNLGVAIGSDVQAYAAALDAVSGTNTGDEAVASTTVSGTVELLTTAELDTGTDTTRAATAAAIEASARSVKLDAIEALADVTDATNVAAAGAAMTGGAHHDGFSDFVADEHVAHAGVSITVAGTANEVVSSAGAQTIAASRTWTLGIADAPTIPGDYMTMPVKVDPAPTGANGRMYYNSTDDKFRYAVSTAWKTVVNTADAQTFTADTTFSAGLIIPQNVATSTAGEITTDDTLEQLIYRTSAGEQVLQATLSKAQGWVDPVSGDTMLLMDARLGAITIVRVAAHRTAGTSVAWELRFGADPTAAGTLSVGATTSATTTVTQTTSFTDATIPANNAVWIELDTVTGSVTKFFIEVFYTIDRA